MPIISRIICAFLVLALSASQAFAQQDDKKTVREREVLRRLQAEQQMLSSQVQALSSEKASLASAVAAKAKELEEVRAKLKKRESAESQLRGELKSRVAQVRVELEKLETRAQDSATQLRDMTELNSQKESAIKVRDAEIRDLKAKLEAQREVIARQVQLLSSAEEKNKRLAKIGRDLMARYKGKGVMDALMQKEPFTQIENVRIQNTLQEFDEKLETYRLAMPDLGG